MSDAKAAFFDRFRVTTDDARYFTQGEERWVYQFGGDVLNACGHRYFMSVTEENGKAAAFLHDRATGEYYVELFFCDSDEDDLDEDCER